MTMTVLVDGEGETEPELNFFALVFFLFCQANFILVPFPAHCQQVPSMCDTTIYKRNPDTSTD